MPNRVGVLPAFPASTIPAAPSQNIILRQGAESGDLTGMVNGGGAPIAATTAPASGGWCYALPLLADTLVGSVGAAKTDMRISFRYKTNAPLPNATTFMGSVAPSSAYFRLQYITGDTLRLTMLGTDTVTYTGNQTSVNRIVIGAWNDIVVSIKAGISARVWLNGILAITLDLGVFTSQPWSTMQWRGVDSFVDDIVISSDPNDASIDGMRITSVSTAAPGQGILLMQGAESGAFGGGITAGSGAPTVVSSEHASGGWAYSSPLAGDYVVGSIGAARVDIRMSFRYKSAVAPPNGINFLCSYSPNANNFRLNGLTGGAINVTYTAADTVVYSINQASANRFIVNEWNEFVISIQQGVAINVWFNGVLALTAPLTTNVLLSSTSFLWRCVSVGTPAFIDDIVVSSNPLDASIDGMRLGGLPEAMAAGGRVRHDLFRARRNGVLLPKRAAGVIVAPVVIPTNASAPVVSPTTSLTPGVTVSCTTGSWNNSPSSYTYQWKRGGVDIAGATNLTYVLVTADIAAVMTCAVVATNVAGSSTAALSNATSAVNAPALAPVNTVAPAVTPATGVQTDTLLTTTNGTWSNTPTGYTYQWQANGVNIASATAATFTVTATQVGSPIRCVVTASNASGANPANSNATNSVTALAPVNTVAPAVTPATGVQTGTLLTTTNGTWSNTPTSYLYQWQAGGVDITGATAATFTVTTTQLGAVMRCVVTAVNSGGSVSANSNATNAATALAPVNTVAPAVTPTTGLNTGSVVTTTNGTWSNAPTSYTYQWQANSVNISGATASSFTITATQIGAVLRCVVTAINTGGSVPANSNVTGAVAAIAPVNTVAPAVTPTANLRPGDVVTTTNGTWSNTPTGYTYQWQDDGVNISGATASTYTLTTAEIAGIIRCAVTATNTGGSVTANSNNTSAVLPLAPVNTVAPVVTPTAGLKTGDAVNTTNGTWSNVPTGYTYQWQADGVNVGGGTGATLTLAAGQVGKVMRCVVTAANAGGSASANSNDTAVVTAPLAPPANLSTPVVTGGATVSMLMASSTGTWSNTPTGYTYQWCADGVDIPGATASTYRLTLNEVGDNLTCRVRASNADGFADAESGPVPCVRGWQPEDLPGAYAWYDMGDPLTMTPATGLEGDQITNLADKLGNPGRNMPVVSASTPTLKLNKLNGLPGLQMSIAGDTADARLYNASMPLGSAPLTVYVIAAVPSFITNSAARVVSFAPAALADTDVTATRINRATTTNQMALSSGGATKFSAAAETAITVDVPFQMAFNWDLANCYVEREGGNPLVSAQVASRNITRVALGCGIQASGTGLSGVSWRGMIYEVMICNVINTLVDRQKMTGWQAWRWGRQSLLPAGHPWKNSPPLPPAGPAAVTAPVVTGGRTLNMLLTSSPGTYDSTPDAVSYQWSRNNVPIAGATAATYRIVAADVDTTLRCKVKVTGLGGETFSNSNDTAVVRGWQPDDAPSPQIWWSADDPTKMTPSTGAEGAQITALANKFAPAVSAATTVASTLKNNIQGGLPGLYGFDSVAAVSKLNTALSGIDTSSFTVYAVAKSLTAASALSNMRLISMARTGFADTAATSFRIAKQGNTQALAVTIANAVHASMPYVLDQTFQIAVGVSTAAITAEMDGGADTADAVTSALNVQTLGWACQVINGGVGVDSLAWNGNAYDLLIFKAAHDLATRQKMAGWLAWRWGLEAQLPSNHPYKLEPPGLSNPIVNPSGLPFKSGWFGGASAAQWATFRGCNVDCTLTFPGENTVNYTSGGWTGPYSSWINNSFVGSDVTAARALVPYVVVTIPLMNYTDRQQFASIASRASTDVLFTTHTAIANQLKSLIGTDVIGIRLGHEANATNLLSTTDPLGSKGRYPWTYINPEGGAYAVPADYRAAWARVAAIYKTILGFQVKMIWNQVWQKNTEQRYTDYYPGDDYVDVLGFDTYDNGSQSLPVNSDANWNVLLGYYNATTGRGKGLMGCLDFAKSRGKKMSVEEWALLNGPRDPADPTNNSVFATKMKGFFDTNAAYIDHENYFNLSGAGHTIYPYPTAYADLTSLAYQNAYP